MFEGALPIFVHEAAAILSGCRAMTVARQHGIGGPVQRNVPLDRLVANGFVAAFVAQPFELGVQIEDQGRILESACGAARVWVKADDEKAATPNAHAEVWGIWVRIHSG